MKKGKLTEQEIREVIEYVEDYQVCEVTKNRVTVWEISVENEFIIELEERNLETLIKKLCQLVYEKGRVHGRFNKENEIKKALGL